MQSYKQLTIWKLSHGIISTIKRETSCWKNVFFKGLNKKICTGSNSGSWCLPFKTNQAIILLQTEHASRKESTDDWKLQGEVLYSILFFPKDPFGLDDVCNITIIPWYPDTFNCLFSYQYSAYRSLAYFATRTSLCSDTLVGSITPTLKDPFDSSDHSIWDVVHIPTILAHFW